jgi:RNA polymerase sigma factor (sigma-70 family)
VSLSEKIRNETMEDNMDLVPFVARKEHLSRFAPDILQEGYFGLCYAVENYDLDLGAFSSYAYPCIRGFMLRSLEKEKQWHSRREDIRKFPSSDMLYPIEEKLDHSRKSSLNDLA